MIVDSHCHLDMLTEHDSIDNIVNRAKKEGVEYLQTICTKLDEFDNILNIAKKYENVFASVGVHPSEVKEIVECAKLVELSAHEKVIGVGETGLDYYYNKEKNQLDMQKYSFEQHIMASQQNKLPVIIHMRDAEEDTTRIIAKQKQQADFPALIHCFTASKEFAIKMLDLGLYISISGIVTFKNAIDLQEVVKFIPAERILVETDSPYLAPVPNRGKTNEPAYTKYVNEFVANLKGTAPEKMAEITTDNFFTLFSKAKRA